MTVEFRAGLFELMASGDVSDELVAKLRASAMPNIGLRG